MPYSWAVQCRNRRYDRGGVERLEVPVVSVGNLTLGGTGKTPTVAWLAEWFQRQGRRPAIVSRGYRSGSQAWNDEALELAQRLPNIPQVQNPDRIVASRQAIARFGCDIILLDDGFQHRRLGRDLDLVLLDATEPFGFEHVFPRGTLREPLSGLSRAEVVVLSRANLLTAPQRSSIRQRVAQLAPTAQWLEIAQTPTHFLNSSRQKQALDVLRGPPLAAFCGIGNPSGFQQMLQSSGFDVAVFRTFPDHHPFSTEDTESIARSAAAAGAEAVVCTHKDLVKFEQDRLNGIPFWALVIETEVLSGQEQLLELLRSLLEARPAGSG